MTGEEHRGVRIRRIGSKWHPVTRPDLGRKHVLSVWFRAASERTGLGNCGAGYARKAQLLSDIDTAIAVCGQPPTVTIPHGDDERRTV